MENNDKSKVGYNLYYSTDAEYRYISESTLDIKDRFGTWYTDRNIQLNWMDNETVEVYSGFNNTNRIKCIWLEMIDKSGMDLYYVVDEDIPVATTDNNYFGVRQVFKLSYKLTFLRAFVRLYRNESDYYLFKRSNVFGWDPRINTPCPKVKKVMENRSLRTIYRSIDMGASSWYYYGANSNVIPIPWIIYYVFADNGKFFVYPLLDGNDSLLPNQGGMELRYKGYQLTGSNASLRWNNNLYTLNRYAAQNKTSGFIGKFMGLNWCAIGNPSNITPANWFKCGGTGRFVEKTYGNEHFKGLLFTNDFWSNDTYSLYLGRYVNNGLVSRVDDTEYNFEHLRYLDLGMFKNVFDLPILFWCQYGSNSGGDNTGGDRVNLKCIDAQIKADGFYVTFTNNSGTNKYLEFVDPEAAVFHLSDQLPLAIDTYIQWSNDNSTTIKSNLAIKEVTAAVGILTSAIIAIAGIAAAPVTGGVSLGATLATIGGVAGMIGGGVSMGTTAGSTVSTLQQAEKKYHGNIVSGGGVDFAYYNYYIKNLQTGSIDYNYKRLTYQCKTFDDSTFKMIQEIIYYFGYPGNRLTEYMLFGRNTSPTLDFIYNEFDVEKSPRLQRRIADFSSRVPNWCNSNKIAEYITRRLENGVRYWSPYY